MPNGAPRRVTSRSLNDAVIRRATPPVAQPRTAAGPTLLVFLTSPVQSLATAYVQFSQGVMDGLDDSLKSTWSLLSHDMLTTYREMVTTLTALGLLAPLNVAQSLTAARALDARLGTHVASAWPISSPP